MVQTALPDRRGLRPTRRPGPRPLLATALTVVLALAVAGPSHAAAGDAVVDKPEPLVTVSVTPDTVVARASAPAPDLPVPTGSVDFDVDGVRVGTADLVDGRAVLHYQVPTGASRVITAWAEGDDVYGWGSDRYYRTDPSMQPRVSPAPVWQEHVPGEVLGPTWYTDPVTVRFECWTASPRVPLLDPCPAPVVLDKSGMGQSASGTVRSVDGGGASARVDGINIDLDPPEVVVTGVEPGATYLGGAPKGGCQATDALSGVSICHVRRTVDGDQVTYVPDATDKAVNQVVGAPVVVWASSLVLDGTDRDDEGYVVRRGSTYRLQAASQARPRPLGTRSARAVPTRLKPKVRAFRHVGHHRWSTRVLIPRKARPGDRFTLSSKVDGRVVRVAVRVR